MFIVWACDSDAIRGIEKRGRTFLLRHIYLSLAESWQLITLDAADGTYRLCLRFAS